MPRKKKLPDGGEAEPEVATQEVEALHTVKYKTPMRVPIEVAPDEPEEEDEEEFDLEEIEEDEKPKRRAPQASFRNKIKQKFVDKGIGGGELIALRIDQLPNYAVDGISGINAEKIFRDALKVTEDYFDNESYLANILRKYGPGDYWLTARVKNSIVHNWLERIGAPVAASPVARTEGEVSSVAQQAFYAAAQPQPAPQKSFVEQIEEFARISTALNKIQGRSEGNTEKIEREPVSDDIQLASILMKDPDIKAKAIKGLLGTAGQETDIMSLVIENLDKILTAGGKALEGVIQTAVVGVQQIKAQGGYQNGQAQAGIQANAIGIQHSQGNGLVQTMETSQEIPIQMDAQNAGHLQAGGAQALHASQNGASPEDQALDFIIDQCAKKTPVKIAADRLFNIADEIRVKAPGNSIDGYIEMFAETPANLIIQWLSTNVPGSQPVLDMPHSTDWITSLQETVKAEISQGGEDE